MDINYELPDDPVISPSDLKGLWIPSIILYNKDLTYAQKFLLSFIWHLDGEHNCYASNKYLAQLLCLSTSRIASMISELKSSGYIEQVYFDGKIRKLKCLIKNT